MIEIIIPNFKLTSINNTYEHWTKRKKRVDREKNLVSLYVRPKIHLVRLPVSIELIRIAPRKFDDSDNLRSAFKSVKDQIASLFFPELKPGRADDLECFKWYYSQGKMLPKQYLIHIKITSI